VKFGKRLTELVKFFYAQCKIQRFVKAKTEMIACSSRVNCDDFSDVTPRRSAICEHCLGSVDRKRTLIGTHEKHFEATVHERDCWERVINGHECVCIDKRATATVVVEPSSSLCFTTDIMSNDYVKTIDGAVCIMVTQYDDSSDIDYETWLTPVKFIKLDVCRSVWIGIIPYLDDPSVKVILLETWGVISRELSKDISQMVLARLGLINGDRVSATRQ